MCKGTRACKCFPLQESVIYFLQLWVTAGGFLSTGGWLTLVCWKCDPIPIPDGEPGEGTGEVFGEGWRFPVISIMSWPMSFSSSSGKGRSNMSSEGWNREKAKFWLLAVSFIATTITIAIKDTFLQKKTAWGLDYFMHKLFVTVIWKEMFQDKDATCWCKKATEYTVHKTNEWPYSLICKWFQYINTIF